MEKSLIEKHLPPEEWLIIVLICLSLLLLTALTMLSNATEVVAGTSPHRLVQQQQIEVYVQGSVESPGSYQFNKGAIVEDAIIASKPLPEADLKKIKIKSKLRHGQKINIPNTKTITINLEGAVEKPGKLILPKGTRLQDLPDHVKFAPEADLRKIKKRKLLKDCETVYIHSLKAM